MSVMVVQACENLLNMKRVTGSMCSVTFHSCCRSPLLLKHDMQGHHSGHRAILLDQVCCSN